MTPIQAAKQFMSTDLYLSGRQFNRIQFQEVMGVRQSIAANGIAWMISEEILRPAGDPADFTYHRPPNVRKWVTRAWVDTELREFLEAEKRDAWERELLAPESLTIG